MAVASHVSVIALGAAWWGATYRDNEDELTRVRTEIRRSASFLADAWDGEELLIGIGTQRSGSSLLAFESFSSANRALGVGPPEDPELFPLGPATMVAPECEYATADEPAAEVAAHVAAALSLAAAAELAFSAQADVAEWETKAVELLAYSVALTDENDPADVTDARVPMGMNQTFGVRPLPPPPSAWHARACFSADSRRAVCAGERPVPDQ